MHHQLLAALVCHECLLFTGGKTVHLHHCFALWSSFSAGLKAKSAFKEKLIRHTCNYFLSDSFCLEKNKKKDILVSLRFNSVKLKYSTNVHEYVAVVLKNLRYEMFVSHVNAFKCSLF